MHRNAHALFGGEGLVLLSHQGPASYPTPFVRITPLGQKKYFRVLTEDKGLTILVYMLDTTRIHKPERSGGILL